MTISYASSIQHTTYTYLLIPKPFTNFFGFLARCPFFCCLLFCLETVRKGLLFLVVVVVVILMGLRMNDRSTQMHNPSTPQWQKEEYYVKCVLIYITFCSYSSFIMLYYYFVKDLHILYPSLLPPPALLNKQQNETKFSIFSQGFYTFLCVCMCVLVCIFCFPFCCSSNRQLYTFFVLSAACCIFWDSPFFLLSPRDFYFIFLGSISSHQQQKKYSNKENEEEEEKICLNVSPNGSYMNKNYAMMFEDI